MRATLEFNLPEEQLEHRLACEAQALSGVVTTALEAIRARLKYAQDVAESERLFLESLRRDIYEGVNGLLDL